MKIAFPDSEWAIVSASEHEWLTLTVSSLFPEDYFDKVLGAPNTKDQHFTDLEARNRRTLSIGDTVADFEISSKHSSDFVLVDDWSLDSRLNELPEEVNRFRTLDELIKVRLHNDN